MKLEYKWICPICNTVLQTRKQLYDHQKEYKHYKKVPTKESVCLVCNKVFNTLACLTEHIKLEKHYKKEILHYEWLCPICGIILESRRKFQKHKKDIHSNIYPKFNFLPGGNCKFCNKNFNRLCTLNLHEKRCKLNPNRIEYKGHPVSEETKEKLRQKALEGHCNGTYKGWMNCHSSNMSYPEKFFTDVIKNEFTDKNYEYNYLFFHYRLDFAWPDKKKCIEIDGSQHESGKQFESDKRKDQKLLEEGWQVLRINWKDIFNDTRTWIDKAINFIN